MISIVTGAIGLLVAVAIVLLMRNDSLHIRHGLMWIFVAILFSFLGFFPSVIDSVARILGIANPPVLAITIGFSVGVIKLLMMDIEWSRLEVRHQRLIQRVALLETELRYKDEFKREDD